MMINEPHSSVIDARSPAPLEKVLEISHSRHLSQAGLFHTIPGCKDFDLSDTQNCTHLPDYCISKNVVGLLEGYINKKFQQEFSTKEYPGNS